MQLMAPFLAGLGLFFCGVHFLSANLTPLAGRRFRLALTRLLRRPWLAAFTGILAGVVTQSTNAVTYVIIGLVSGGVVDKRRAILIPTWAHVGTAVLVILVAVDFKVAASYLVALAGFAVYFGADRNERARHVVGVILGIGLLFLGLDTLKTGAMPLRDVLLRDDWLAYLVGHPVLLLFVGIGLTLICQSSTVVGAIAVATTSIGIFGTESAVWLVLGSNLGSGLNHFILAKTMRGDAAQIALIQVAQKLAGFAGILAIMAMEAATSKSFLISGTSLFTDSASGKVAVVFLIYQLIGSLFCTMFFSQIVATLEWLSPPSQLQEMSKPAFLIDEALVEPTFAIELVGREERRLLERLPLMLDGMRADSAGVFISSATIRASGVTISRAMANYIEQISEAGLDRADRERVVRFQHRTANLTSLFEAIDEFVTTSRAAREWPTSARVADQMIEALHALLTALVEATASEDETDREILLSLLGHRDEMMERIRQRVLREDPDMPPKAQEALFSTTMLFERIIWLGRRSALLLTSETALNNAEIELAA